jgi:hypothetical protein
MGAPRPAAETAIIADFGMRGLGSICYSWLCDGKKAEFQGSETVWMISIKVHGVGNRCR